MSFESVQAMIGIAGAIVGFGLGVFSRGQREGTLLTKLEIISASLNELKSLVSALNDSREKQGIRIGTIEMAIEGMKDRILRLEYAEKGDITGPHPLPKSKG